MIRSLTVVFIFAAAGFGAMRDVVAQQIPPSSTSLTLQQQLVHTEARRRDRIAGNMLLSPDEARRFWPVYDEYRAAVVQIRKRQMEVIVEYADAYNRGAVAPGKAKALLAEAMQLEADRDRLKRAYIRDAAGVLDPTRQLRLYQVETRLDAEAQAGVLAQIPLAQ